MDETLTRLEGYADQIATKMEDDVSNETSDYEKAWDRMRHLLGEINERPHWGAAITMMNEELLSLARSYGWPPEMR